ncbi:MAG: class I SAM-dependent RNA methyltransferase [Candidatus Cloacimonetes bacterium]|nr:class I SAM-dependent RNA methyltransferase [Candidatus Cloacimonadota bacterium]
MEYQKNSKYFAQVAGSLEPIAALELQELGAADIQTTYRGISFSADEATLYRILYQTRICSRILAPLISFQCHSEKYLHKSAMQIDWTQFLDLKEKFAINSNVSNSKISNSMYAGQVLKDAICDVFREKFDARPDFDAKEADVRFNLHISENWANISIDLGGEPLHKRGYRKETVKAPLQETLAAAIIRLTLWNGEQMLYDPFCGSGTILTEAIMHYCRIPAGFLRKEWGIFRMPGFNKELWDKLKAAADNNIRDLPEGLLAGSDIAGVCVHASIGNCNTFSQGRNVVIKRLDYREIDELENMVIATNPPFGKRLYEGEAEKILKELGDFLKQKCQGSRAYVLVGSKELAFALRLRYKMNKLLKNGDIESRLLRIDLY